jgi:integrase
MLKKSHLKLVSSQPKKRTVRKPKPAGRLPNADYRPREHLTESEVEKLIGAAKGNRWGQRDASMILIAFRHGLRASELCSLQWSDIEFETASIHLRRAKGGVTSTHPLQGDELRALRALKKIQAGKSPFIFTSERGSPFSVSGLAKMIERAGVEAKLPFPVHMHMLRHAAGFALANKGIDTRTLQAYLGHRSIQSTVRYAELAPNRFKNIWRD